MASVIRNISFTGTIAVLRGFARTAEQHTPWVQGEPPWVWSPPGSVAFTPAPVA